jgi:hypothetical protein
VWLADSVAITILDYGRGNTVLIEIETPVGRLQAVGELEQIGLTLYFRRAHIQGLDRGCPRASWSQCDRCGDLERG